MTGAPGKEAARDLDVLRPVLQVPGTIVMTGGMSWQISAAAITCLGVDHCHYSDAMDWHAGQI